MGSIGACTHSTQRVGLGDQLPLSSQQLLSRRNQEPRLFMFTLHKDQGWHSALCVWCALHFARMSVMQAEIALLYGGKRSACREKKMEGKKHTTGRLRQSGMKILLGKCPFFIPSHFTCSHQRCAYMVASGVLPAKVKGVLHKILS